jgi:hypothetical protein
MTTSALNQVDLAFIIDTTGSMGGFIGAAQQHMIALLDSLVRDPLFPLDLRVAVVEYRDHPPQDNTFASRPHPFTSNLAEVQNTINTLKPDGGGDAPESVYDGLACASTLDWRPYSRRIAVLIGDAPPHDTRTRPEAKLALFGDCTCGLMLDEVTAQMETTGLQFYSLSLTVHPEAAFTALSQMTGGTAFHSTQAQQAIAVIKDLLVAELNELEFDRQVLEQWQAGAEVSAGGSGEVSIERISEALAAGPGRVAKSLTRLGRRRLLEA